MTELEGVDLDVKTKSVTYTRNLILILIFWGMQQSASMCKKNDECVKRSAFGPSKTEICVCAYPASGGV